jgi:hypothetical protein
VEDFLSNGTLDRRYARIILLSKEWSSEEVVILRSECVDNVNSFFLWLLGPVLSSVSGCSSSWSLLFLRVGTPFVDVQEIANAVLERELLLLVLDCETDLSTIRVDDGF